MNDVRKMESEIEKGLLLGQYEKKKEFERPLVPEGTMYFGVVKKYDLQKDKETLELVKNEKGHYIGWLTIEILCDVFGKADFVGVEISNRYTHSFNEGSNLMQKVVIPLVFGEEPVEGERIDISEIVGMKCKFSTKEVTSKKEGSRGKKFSVIDRVYRLEEDEPDRLMGFLASIKEIEVKGKKT